MDERKHQPESDRPYEPSLGSDVTPVAAQEDDFLAGLADEFAARVRGGERPTVEEYVAKHPSLADRITKVLQAVAMMEETRPLDAVAGSDRPGSTIGRYKLLERIGEGGFGVVYMAEQHHPVRRKVALKVIKPGMDSRQILARFEAERQALAIMDHPNIARVLDAGATDNGRPYFVMELVKGEPITEYCDHNQLEPRQRLELFLQVCHAVQHAHQKGIIHRDIKPSNVLVSVHDTTPVIKVIDFGVAKALGQELTEKTLFTGFAQLVGTPLYMSPEQAGQSSLDIDTRSDIYSLGVLLYELLTGTTPFDKERFKQAAHEEIRRIIREEEPPRPSTRLSQSKERLPSISAQRHTEPAKLTRLLRGELDWIVMKALEKDRNRRYETANGFAMDVQRYLADEQVAACPPSAVYKLKKFVRRHRGSLSTAAAIAAVLVLATAISSWQAVRATRATRQVGHERDKAVAAEQQADRERNLALAEKQRADAQERATRIHLYATQMNLAQQAWEKAEIARMNELLTLQIPDPGEEDLRGFEWYYLWGLAHSEHMSFFAGDEKVSAIAVAVSSDGKRLASASGRSIKLWDRAGARLEREFALGVDARCVAFSPDGRYLAAGGGRPQKPGVACVWDVNDLNDKQTLKEVGGTVLCLAFSPDSKALATGTAQILPYGGLVWARVMRVNSSRVTGEIRLWEPSSGKQLGTLEGETNGVLCVAFSPDGKRLVAGSWDKTLSAWNVRTRGKVESSKSFSGFVWSAAFSPDGGLLAVGSGDWDGFPGTTLLDARTLEERTKLYGHRVGTASVAFSPDGKTLASGSFDHTAKLWDVSTGVEKHTIRGHSGFVVSVAFAPDGQSLATASWDRFVKLWDVTAAQGETVYGEDRAGTYCVAFSPDSRTLAASTRNTWVLLDMAAEMPRQRGRNSTDDQMISFSRDGAKFATTGIGGVTEVWDAQTGRLLQSLSANKEKIWDATFSPDGKMLATGAVDRCARLWDLASGQVIHTFEKQGGTVRSVTFSPDGELLVVAASGAAAVNVYDLNTFRLVESIPGLGVLVQFTPDMKTLIGVTWSGVQFWDREKRAMRSSSRGHTEFVYDMALSGDGRTVATASWDGTVKIWHVASGDLMLSLNPEGGAAWTVGFSPDGRMLAAGAGTTVNQRRRVKVWHAPGREDVTIDPSTLDEMNIRAWRLREAGRLNEAAAVRQQVVDNARASMSRNDSRRIRYQLDYALLLIQMKRFEESERLLLDSRAALEEPEANKGLVLRVTSGLGELYAAWDKEEKATVFQTRLPALRAATQAATTQDSATVTGTWQVTTSPDRAARKAKAVVELAEKRIALFGADCEYFYILAAADARRREVDRARMWLLAGDQRLERYCPDVAAAKAQRADATRVLQAAGVTLPSSPERTADRLRRCQEMIENDPQAPWAYQLRGQVYAETGERDKAEADYQRAFELLAGRRGISLDDAQAVHDFAATSLAQRQWDVAIASFGRLLELGGDYKRPQKDGLSTRVWPHHERGYAYGWLPDYEKAAAEYSKAIELAPDHADLWARRASIYVANGEFDKALKDYSRAIDLAPDHPSGWPWSDYAAVLLQLGRWPQAAAHLEGIARAQPKDVNVAYQHALVLLGAGDLNGYRGACRQMVERFQNVTDIATAHWIAWTCALGPGALDDLTPAVAAAERAAAAEPQNLQLLTTLGAVLCRAGRYHEAIERLKQVERQTPEPAEAAPSSPAYAWFFLAMAYHRLGSDAEAGEWHTRASRYTDNALGSADPHGAASTPWNRKLTLRLLRDESDLNLRPSGTNRPVQNAAQVSEGIPPAR